MRLFAQSVIVIFAVAAFMAMVGCSQGFDTRGNPSIAPAFQGIPGTSDPNSSVNPFLKQSVKNAYQTRYRPNVAKGLVWSGQISGCVSGEPGSGFREATVNVLNYYRALVGLPDNVQLDLNASEGAQASALMMAANGQLNHNPPSTWNCYTQLGASTAGSSNIALGAEGPSAINLYMDDWGSNNSAVGHRRWILYPSLSSVGSGTVNGADTLKVIGGWGNRADTPNGVSWPAMGFFPIQHLPGSRRWSFSKYGAGLGGATVSMTKNGVPVGVTLEPFYYGYGDDTIVWIPDSVDSSPATYVVTLKNVSINGAAKTISYQIDTFDAEN
jgi:uncharacterized protein YkwD